MLRTAHRILILLLLASAAIGVLISMGILSLDFLLGEDFAFESANSLDRYPSLSIETTPTQLSPADSPLEINITINSPSLAETDFLFIEIYGGGRLLTTTDCLSGLESYAGRSQFDCTALVPYNYAPGEEYRIFAILSTEDGEFASDPITLNADWRAYEANFGGFSLIAALLLVLVYLLVLVPATLFVFHVASNTKHHTLFEGEYSFRALFAPFSKAKTLLQKLNSFIISPYFWALEVLGIVIIIVYMAFMAQVWKSWTALFAFIFSGLAAFIIPYLWCIAWWYADYKEREPLRILITLFLWGMLAAMVAIGINTVGGLVLGLIGLGFLGTFLVAPIAEEFYKGAGACLLSEHHEYDSLEDGIVFGFVIGMGFAFIENWLYFLNNPLGSDIGGWIFLFLLRSVVFSANHGFYTAITGGIVGYLIAHKFQAPSLGIFVALPIAAFFHAMHNSGELLVTLLGLGGTLLYCCFFIPLFDYGGFIIMTLFFLRAIFAKPK